ncbi:MoaD/ThiS family protein [Campylobacter sp. MG1]|uniref:MoaD/ThiS family protein n=1 Tax=Campylobacter sp. MG1 TaxID=2976332 RepID=UPI00226CDE91|nr:MoaD/ThiS family protein [Campylobacter sp. MG1]
MPKINFLGPINKDSITIKAQNLEEIKSILNKDSDLKEWLKISAIAVNDTIISDINMQLKDDDIVSILPPVCGG